MAIYRRTDGSKARSVGSVRAHAARHKLLVAYCLNYVWMMPASFLQRFLVGFGSTLWIWPCAANQDSFGTLRSCSHNNITFFLLLAALYCTSLRTTLSLLCLAHGMTSLCS